MLRWAGILLVSAAISVVCIEARGGKEPVKTPESVRSDVVMIDTLAAYGKLEMPAVTFLHDKHTDVLLKEKKDCKTCHLLEDGKLSLAFKRKKANKPDEFKDIYHSNCIGCHKEMAGEGKKSGPLDGACRSCHDAAPKVSSAPLPVEVNKVLHFRHVDSKNIASNTTDKDNCGSCHHEYDKQAKKIFYAKGKESTCRYCHLEAPKDDVKSMRQASHLQCVQCHLDLAAKGVKETGPYVCAGCHSANGQALSAKKNQELAAKFPDHEVPRLKREQPDNVLMSFDPKMGDGKAGDMRNSKPILMNPVAFDHKAHEKYNDSCRVCHHASLDSCQKCHTLSGVKEGDFIGLEKAMHLTRSNYSCRGCHAVQKNEGVCVGCHSRMAGSVRTDTACRSCHMELPAGVLAEGRSPLDLVSLPTQQKSGIAESMLKARRITTATYAIEDIPEKAIIGELSNQYQPAEMPHRKIVLTLMKGMKDNKLAGYFHSDPGTICQGCHHNSPAAKQPPRCGNCHGKPFDAREPNRPALQAAFHQECMGCHKALGVKPFATACTECHKEKQK